MPPAPLPASAPGTDEFAPQSLSMLREGYGTAALRADILAGLTVAIVALPLSIGIAIASGGRPEQGLISAVIGGFLISALGGSRFQIGGPAGAFIALVAVTVERFRHGRAFHRDIDGGRHADCGRAAPAGVADTVDAATPSLRALHLQLRLSSPPARFATRSD